MSNTIAVMNTKGGVGKSTMVLAIAETLSVYEGKSVLVIDSDAQASVSSMLMSPEQLFRVQSEGLTLVEYLVATVLNDEQVDHNRFILGGVSDVDDAFSVYLMPSDDQLTLFERQVSHEQRHEYLRHSIASLLHQVRQTFDITLIDCPPGLSVLTESWLREADYHLTPTRADYISSCGLEVFRRFKEFNPEMGFAENLGVVINMKDRLSASDDEYHKWLASEPENRVFDSVIPRTGPVQDAARFLISDRSFPAKYPGEAGSQIRKLAKEILARLEARSEQSEEAHQDVGQEAVAEPAAIETNGNAASQTYAPNGQSPETDARDPTSIAPNGEPRDGAAHDTPVSGAGDDAGEPAGPEVKFVNSELPSPHAANGAATISPSQEPADGSSASRTSRD